MFGRCIVLGMTSQQPSSSRYHASQLSLLGQSAANELPPVAICTLVDDELREKLVQQEALKGVLVGALHTENIGIEQIITYVVSTPHIRFLILCGTDGQQAVGHLPGQTFLALAQNGMDESATVIGALGKRPVLKNIKPEAVAHFRKQIEMIDLIGCQDVEKILAVYRQCVEKNPGPTKVFEADEPVMAILGKEPENLVMDTCGYFVIYAEHDRGVISVEHYNNQGKLQHVIEGETGPEIYHTISQRGFIALLDHAAYLGRELQRAEDALRYGHEYVQDQSR